MLPEMDANNVATPEELAAANEKTAELAKARAERSVADVHEGVGHVHGGGGKRRAAAAAGPSAKRSRGAGEEAAGGNGAAGPAKVHLASTEAAEASSSDEEDSVLVGRAADGAALPAVFAARADS